MRARDVSLASLLAAAGLVAAALLPTTTALAAPPPAPAAPAAEKPTIYVDDIRAEGPLATDAAALTTTLCTSLARGKRFEIACAPDIKQILSFAATAGLMGVEASTSNKVEERLGKVGYVVTGVMRKDGAAYVLTLQAAPRGDESDGVMIVPGKMMAAAELRGDAPKQLLTKLDGASEKLLAAIGAATMAPAAAPVQAAAPVTPAAPAAKK